MKVRFCVEVGVYILEFFWQGSSGFLVDIRFGHAAIYPAHIAIGKIDFYIFRIVCVDDQEKVLRMRFKGNVVEVGDFH